MTYTMTKDAFDATTLNIVYNLSQLAHTKPTKEIIEAYNLFKCTDEQLEEFIKHLERVKFELNSLTYNYVTSKTWRYLKVYREADDA